MSSTSETKIKFEVKVNLTLTSTASHLRVQKPNSHSGCTRSSWMQKHIQTASLLSRFQLVMLKVLSKFQNQAKTSQRHVVDLANISKTVKRSHQPGRSNLQLMAKFEISKRPIEVQHVC